MTRMRDRLTRTRARLLGFVLLLLASPLAALAATLQDLSVQGLAGDLVEIRLAFDAPPPAASGYTIDDPARIVIDLPGVASTLASRHHELGQGNARRLSVLPAPDRTRLIFNLDRVVPYTTRVAGNDLIVRIGDGTPAPTDASIPTATYEPENSAIPRAESGSSGSVTGIDFRRGDGGEGRVLVSLGNGNVPVDITRSGETIRVEITGTTLPAALARRLDVGDFATPVRTIDALPDGQDTVLSITAGGEFDYIAWQSDNTLTIQVSPPAPASGSPDERAFPYQGKKLTLNFQDIEVRSVLQLIADFTDLNLVASDTVTGRITLRLRNVPWDQALDLILKTKGLDQRQVGNVLLVAPAAEIAAREKQELENQRQFAALAPLRTEFIQIRYASANELLRLFTQQAGNGAQAGGTGAQRASAEPAGGGGVGSILSPRGSVIVDERTNAIIISDTSDRIEAFRRIIAQLDIAVRQVLIEARIVTASSNSSEQLGIRWGGGASWDNGQYQASGSSDAVNEIRSGAVGGTSPGNLLVDLGVTAPGASGLAIGVTGESYLLDLELSALATEGSAEVVARPKVITADKSPATIRSGVEVPYQEAASSGATSTSFKDAVLSLEVTPQITPDDRIIMDLNVTQDTVGQTFNGIPSINTNAIETQVLVDNAQTVVLGGIFIVDRNQSISKTPLLGDIPYVGRMFRRTAERDDKQELLIFITPKIVQDTLSR
jgi:type IV pilus assembly protein PilQ